MSFTRSATGCLACKIKHKKCDETKPHCLRCQKSRVECPGYTYVQDETRPSKKLRTIAAPRTRSGPRAAPVATTEPPDNGLASTSYSVPGPSVVPEAASTSNPWAPSSFNGPLSHSSVNPYHIAPPQNTGHLTFGQASLYSALFSLGDVQTQDPSPPRIATPDPILPSSDLPPKVDTQGQDDVIPHQDEHPQSAVAIIRPELVLDKTAESNAMPFVLQSYATWINRIAFEPEKLMRTSREFVCSHFGDGDQSRWIIGLLANVGSRIGSVDVMESKPAQMISWLQYAVQGRLEDVKSRPRPKRAELVKALDSALDTMIMLFHVSPVSQIMSLVHDVSLVFRQLCPEPAGVPVNLPLLLQHPLGCLRRFAQLDVSFSIVSDFPTLIEYEFAVAGSLPLNPLSPVPPNAHEGVLQWLHGIPNPIILLLAKMKSIRQAGWIPDEKTVEALTQAIYDAQCFDPSSSEPFLGIMRFVVHECWRQAAFIYLYMAVCKDPSDTPRVKKAFRRYMGLLNGTEAGRLPDEHLLPILPIISPAALRKRDRQVLRQRVLGLYSRDQTYVANTWIVFVIDGAWARADAEGRATTWADFAVPHKNVVNG
ncbi:unnamed protein product [Rhizoctonia solani]|uniref:Zn(2)-C6 fungal-type domain-containing protein n=1 Tax=Rhizoctonia solani TaxID=456999 RepID=A0A8H2X6G2_9AGAM|nr:unnamed protein product [Rhizoctonia solani]